MEPKTPGAAIFLPGAGADQIWSEPESAPGPRTSGAGAAQKVAAPHHRCNLVDFLTITYIEEQKGL